MKKFVEKMQNKPENVRKGILYGVSFSVTAIIFLFWVYSLGNRLSAPETKEAFRNDMKPLTVIKDTFSDAFKNISAGAGESQK